MAKKAKASKTTQAGTTAPKSAPKGQNKVKAAAARTSQEPGFGGKPRGRFQHPAGLKTGDKVELTVRKGKKWNTVTGDFQYCNRNSSEYGVILVDGQKVERSLNKFKPVKPAARPRTTAPAQRPGTGQAQAAAR